VSKELTEGVIERIENYLSRRSTGQETAAWAVGVLTRRTFNASEKLMEDALTALAGLHDGKEAECAREWKERVMTRKLSDRDHRIVHEFKDSLLEALADRLKLIKLFGSRARGEAEEWSDLDVLVVLVNGDSSVREDVRQIRYKTMWRHNFRPLISLLLLSEEEYDNLNRLRARLWQNIEREGITIWPIT
jgi:predicted nucleotidyltransferase